MRVQRACTHGILPFCIRIQEIWWCWWQGCLLSGFQRIDGPLDFTKTTRRHQTRKSWLAWRFGDVDSGSYGRRIVVFADVFVSCWYERASFKPLQRWEIKGDVSGDLKVARQITVWDESEPAKFCVGDEFVAKQVLSVVEVWALAQRHKLPPPLVMTIKKSL